jgi:hypothetical protein
MMMIHQRHEQLFPELELKHMNVTSLAVLDYSMRLCAVRNLTIGKFQGKRKIFDSAVRITGGCHVRS